MKQLLIVAVIMSIIIVALAVETEYEAYYSSSTAPVSLGDFF